MAEEIDGKPLLVTTILISVLVRQEKENVAVAVPLGGRHWIAEKYTVLSSIGTSRKLMPSATWCRKRFLKLCPSGMVVMARAAHIGRNLGGFRPRNLATTEFAPSQPITTFALMVEPSLVQTIGQRVTASREIASTWHPKRMHPPGKCLARVSTRSLLFKHRHSLLQVKRKIIQRHKTSK